MSFWESFISIFNLFPSSKTYDETTENLDRKMQDLYDRMGWGKYNYPTTAYNAAADINRVLEAERNLMNEIYEYNTRQVTTTTKKIFFKKRDPARPSINKYL